MIEIDNVSVEFPETQKTSRAMPALDQVSFICRPGRVTGLLGPHGAGKTTLMRVCAGLMAPGSGRVRIHGMDIHGGTSPAGDQPGFVTPEGVLFDRLSPRETLHYIAKLRGMNRTTFETRLASLSDSLGLSGLLHRRVDGFSTGQLRKLSLAAALLHEPSVLLLDDPTAGLDVTSAQEFHAHCRTLADEGKTVLIAGHDPEGVSAICDALVVLHRGKIRATGTLKDITVHHPGRQFNEVLADLCRDETPGDDSHSS